MRTRDPLHQVKPLSVGALLTDPGFLRDAEASHPPAPRPETALALPAPQPKRLPALWKKLRGALTPKR